MDSFAKQLSNIYTIAQENMNMQQVKYKTYYDKQVLDSILEPNDFVFVYMPLSEKSLLNLPLNGMGPIIYTPLTKLLARFVISHIK